MEVIIFLHLAAQIVALTFSVLIYMSVGPTFMVWAPPVCAAAIVQAFVWDTTRD